MLELIRIDLKGVNCYLSKNENGFILFDTGGHLVMDQQFTNRRELLLKELKDAGCTPDNLNLIVLTHGDNDHTCNAAYLRKHYNAPIAMNAYDKELVDGPTLRKWMKSYQYSSVELQHMFLQYQEVITNVTQKTLDEFESFNPDILLEDGFDLSVYGLEAKVFHVPGHTPGSIAIVIKGDELIAGDLFENIEKPGPAPNAIDFPLLYDSINKFKNLTIKTVYPGHGDPFCFEDLQL